MDVQPKHWKHFLQHLVFERSVDKNLQGDDLKKFLSPKSVINRYGRTWISLLGNLSAFHFSNYKYANRLFIRSLNDSRNRLIVDSERCLTLGAPSFLFISMFLFSPILLIFVQIWVIYNWIYILVNKRLWKNVIPQTYDVLAWGTIGHPLYYIYNRKAIYKNYH